MVTTDRKVYAGTLNNRHEKRWTPEHLQAVSWLYGHESPAIKYARILVLGCGDGQQLLAIASGLPQARVVGISLCMQAGPEQQPVIRPDGPQNLELYALTIEQIMNLQDDGWDYIVIQGDFSLLSRQINNRLLQLLSRLLSAQGIIAVEWQCLPGGGQHDRLREALQIYSGSAANIAEQVARSRLMLASMAVTSPSKNIQAALAEGENMSDALFSHHFLDSASESEYLIEFNERVNKLGLSYVGDVNPVSEISASYGEVVEDLHSTLGSGDQKVLDQQFLDLLINRTRRFSLLTATVNAGSILPLPARSRLRTLCFSGSFRRQAANPRSISFSLAGNDGVIVATTDERTLAILDCLGEAWPRSVSFDQLAFHAQSIEADDKTASDSARLAEKSLWALFLKDLNCLYFTKNNDLYQQDEVTAIHPIPAVENQLKADPGAEWLMNGWGQWVAVTGAERQLLTGELIIDAPSWELLDGVCQKGLINAGGIGWKHFLQDMIAVCPADHIGRLACSLLLYSSNESAFGFMTKELKSADKTRNVAKLIQEDIPLSDDERQEVNLCTLRGEYKKAYDLASEYLDSKSDGGAMEYYLYTLARRIGDNEIALVKMAKTLSYHSTSIFLYSELAFSFLSCKYHWQAWRLANAILRCNRNSSPEWYLLASVYLDTKQYEKCEYCARKALAIAPESRLITTLLGGVLCEQTRIDEGIEFLRQAIKDEDRDFGLMTGLGFTLTHSAKASLNEILDLHYRYGRAVTRWAEKIDFCGYIPEDRRPQRKLRIGFVSGDLRDRHPLHFFFSPVWHALDRQKYEVYAYSNIPGHHENEGTDIYRATADKWRNVRHVSDIEMAQMIKIDQIDILVDLSGYTAENRLQVFALKPAPIQISWVGYHATTGLPAMDYYATIFPVKKSAGLEAQFTEKLIYLYLPRNFDQSHYSVELNSLPAISNGYFTFGSFNRTTKLNNAVYDAWAAVLKSVPGSRMIVGNIPKVVWPDISRQFTGRGITEDRFELREIAEIDTYLSYHHDIDLLLDTFPFTGGTVTSHAAWMGVPTVSFAGETLVSRQGAAIMYSLGLAQFVAENLQDYIVTAAAWAGKLDELNQIRSGLRERMKIQGDAQQKIGEHVDHMFRRCWEIYCADAQPESFIVGDAPEF